VLVFDLESDGLYEEATQLWCIVTKNILTQKVDRFYGNTLSTGLYFLDNAEVLIGHNIIDYDLRLIKKLYPLFNPDCLVYDTMLMSQLLSPDRVGGHSLAAFGEKFCRKKPEHEDWSRFSTEMLHRCQEDVEITGLTYNYLQEQAYEHVEGVPYSEIFTDSV